MKTYLPKQVKGNERKWYIIDAKDKVLGRLATTISNLLRGRNSPSFVNFLDNGAYVVVTNCDKIVLTGNKLNSKMYYRHSRYAKDGLKEENASNKLTRQPDFVLHHAVKGMMTNNKLKKIIIERLKLFTGDDHTHTAQQPEIVTL